MTTYDDHTTSCPICGIGLEPQALCDCTTDPMCCRCHRNHHVTNPTRWATQNNFPNEPDNST